MAVAPCIVGVADIVTHIDMRGALNCGCRARWGAAPFGDSAQPGVGAGSLSEGVAPLGVGAVPFGADVAPLVADESALAVERGDNETKAAIPSAMAEA